MEVLVPEVRRLGSPTVIHKLNQIIGSLEALSARVVSVERLLAAESAQKDHLYSRSEAARILGVSTRTIDRRIKAGQLCAVSTGNSLRVTGRSILNARRDDQRRPVEVLAL